MVILGFHSMSVMPIYARPAKFQSERSPNRDEKKVVRRETIILQPCKERKENMEKMEIRLE